MGKINISTLKETLTIRAIISLPNRLAGPSFTQTIYSGSLYGLAGSHPALMGGPLNNKERAQDICRRLMLDVGPRKGMIQISWRAYFALHVLTGG